MKNVSEKIAAFEKKQAEERASFQAELAIDEHVPEGGRVFVSKLYGTVGSVTYGDSIGRTVCTWGRLVEIARALPPVARARVKDACLSHPPMSYVTSLPETKKERWQEECQIAPVMFNVDGGGTGRGAGLSADWYAETPAGTVHVTVQLGHPPHGVIDYSVKRRELRGRVEYSEARVSVCDGMHCIMDGDERVVAHLASPVRWASGGPEYPSNMSLYFDQITEDPDPGKMGIAIVEHVAALVASTIEPKPAFVSVAVHED